MLAAARQLTDPRLGAEAVPVECEHARIAVRERKLDGVPSRPPLQALAVQQNADAVEEDGDVIAHGNRNVLGRTGPSKGRTAYPATRLDP